MTGRINLKVQIGELLLQNPVMPASGAFGEGMDELVDFNQLGAVVPKSITRYPRGGNPTPRICETPSGMINSIGIQSKGLDDYLAHTIPYYSRYHVPLIPSISGDSIEEFVEMSRIIALEEAVAGLELNISCPNLKGNGLSFGMDEEVTYQLISEVRQVTTKPLLAKLTPNVTSIVDIAKSAVRAGADSLVVANTLLAMAIDTESWKPKIGNLMGGLSGPAVRPVIVRMVYQVAQAVDVPIIGCGGIMCGRDAIEMMLAGATAVQIGTASFLNPTAMLEIIEEIKAYLKEHQLEDIQQLIGQAHSQIKQE
ncbi:dihydroorotate dehydrogenase [Pullulanibacillus camelliae]|uniref:Dihydroorotate dehydrogenase n=1 Tax=Pullulanibacillus camelliae TaxID=1707096 RepID=A0A8J2VJX7_9BACL|nr:dihydroorotate dehydrogenase [Pullulanibacillus camelliae]GGE27519.1 dihydroorotate dehydrogenase [Pullulanibacillus camelliae]